MLFKTKLPKLSIAILAAAPDAVLINEIVELEGKTIVLLVIELNIPRDALITLLVILVNTALLELKLAVIVPPVMFANEDVNNPKFNTLPEIFTILPLMFTLVSPDPNVINALEPTSDLIAPSLSNKMFADDIPSPT